MDKSRWEDVHLEALHSIRSLLCTSTNTTPHERIFSFSRRSCNGKTTPSWLMNPGPVLMKRNVRQSKYDPIVDEVHLLEGNPEYSHVRLPDGRETTVSTRHLAPLGAPLEDITQGNLQPQELQPESAQSPSTPSATEILLPYQANEDQNVEVPVVEPEGTAQDDVPLRRSSRVRRPPSYLKDYIVGGVNVMEY
uniref:ATP-dependent RNA helicase mrh4, mitochondrial n=1 Tax=Lygus hesperus TaxID=30085 RepID=A0A0A9WQS8_LYGHE